MASTLREYLMVEYQKRKHNSTLDSESERDNQSHIELFSKETMISACLDVPQQTNSYDCGVYILQYAESFMMVKNERKLFLLLLIILLIFIVL